MKKMKYLLLASLMVGKMFPGFIQAQFCPFLTDVHDILYEIGPFLSNWNVLSFSRMCESES